MKKFLLLLSICFLVGCSSQKSDASSNANKEIIGQWAYAQASRGDSSADIAVLYPDGYNPNEKEIPAAITITCFKSKDKSAFVPLIAFEKSFSDINEFGYSLNEKNYKTPSDFQMMGGKVGTTIKPNKNFINDLKTGKKIYVKASGKEFVFDLSDANKILQKIGKDCNI